MTSESMTDIALGANQDNQLADMRRQMEEARQRREQEEAAAADQPPQIAGELSPQDALGAMVQQVRDGPIDDIAMDIWNGVPEIPGAIIHGTIDAVNEVGDLFESVSTSTAAMIFNATNESGVELTPDIVRTMLGAAEEAGARVPMDVPDIPQPIDAPDTVTGNIAEGLTQFLVGFAGGGSALKTANVLQQSGRGMNVARGFVQGALADMAVFDGHEERLSNFIQEVPALQNPVTDWLAADEDDSEMEGRLKNAIEGAGLGAVIEPLMQGLRSIHRGRTARTTLESMDGQMASADSAAALDIQRDIIDLNGNPNGPAIEFTPESRMADQSVDQIVNDVREGRRGLDTAEREGLLDAATQWAESVAKLQPERFQELNDIISNAREGLNQDDVAGLMDAIDQARTPVEKPVSLIEYLRSRGGIADDEVAGLDINNLLNRKSGRTLDDAADDAFEAGYLGERTLNDDPAFNQAAHAREALLDALNRERGGNSVYSEFDYDAVLELAARADVEEELSRIGVDPTAPRATRERQVEALARRQEGDPLTIRDVERMEADMAASGVDPGVPAPDSALIGGQQVRVNLNALNTPDDIRSIIGQLADAYSDELAAAAGKRSDTQVLRDANHIRAWDALDGRRVGEPLSDSQTLAAQRLYISSAENVRRTFEAARGGGDLAHYNAQRALQVHRAIQAEIAGAKADAGRALRSWSIVATNTNTARRQMIDVMESHGGRFSDEEIGRILQMADNDASALDKAARGMSGREVAADVAGTVLRFAWLSGPQTHIMNLAGNTMTIAYDTLPRLLAGVKGKILGDPALERELGSALREYAGLGAGIRAQFGAFARSADYGRMGRALSDIDARRVSGEIGYREQLMQSTRAVQQENPVVATFRGRFDDRGVAGSRKLAGSSRDRGVSAERFGMSGDTPQGQLLNGMGTILSAPTDFLGFADDFFKGVNELATRYRLSYDKALEEMGPGADRDLFQARMAELVDTPTPQMIDEARTTAQRRTFTEPVGEGVRGVLGLRNWLNKSGFPLGHILLPFVVTPSNILKFAFTNSPTGFLFKEMAEDLRAGGNRAAVAQGRLALGTSLLWLGMDMAANGQVTGAAPKDSGERALWQRSGRQEYSVRVGDKWFSYRRLEPVSTMLGIGADMHNISSNHASTEADMTEALMASLGAAISTVTNKTYLTGVAEFIQFTEDPDRYGSRYGINLASGVLVPAIVSQVERAVDPEIRDAQTVTDRIISRLPGLSDQIPTQRDLWGRERTAASGLGWGYDSLSPFPVRVENPEPIDEELSRIGMFPRNLGRTISVRSSIGMPVDVDISSRNDIFARYVELAGNETKINGMGALDTLNAVVSGRHELSQMYNSLPDSLVEPGSKASFIESYIGDFRQAAMADLQQEFSRDLTRMADEAIASERRSEQRRAVEQARQGQ